ncbi:hypothetical protein CRENBAI_009373 [Crenichthys baileyi]|uniref:Uncharacterized protein n=1 Tax=Crenichthys baileyi TaxID=28760 RepID=A0AAV9QX04_9TELE
MYSCGSKMSVRSHRPAPLDAGQIQRRSELQTSKGPTEHRNPRRTTEGPWCRVPEHARDKNPGDIPVRTQAPLGPRNPEPQAHPRPAQEQPGTRPVTSVHQHRLPKSIACSHQMLPPRATNAPPQLVPQPPTPDPPQRPQPRGAPIATNPDTPPQPPQCPTGRSQRCPTPTR